MKPETIEQLLQELVQIPSINPLEQTEFQSPYGESRVTDYLEKWFQAGGFHCQRQEVYPQRENIFAYLPATSGQSQTLWLWEVHQDTVPVAGMTIDPFWGGINNGRLYGRGACDVKGGMAAMLTAFEKVSKLDQHPGILLACTIGEENGYHGARHLVNSWKQKTFELCPQLPTAAIVAEPTELQLVVAHKGALRWKCTTHGKAAHSSQPEQGENAIFAMAEVLKALEAYQSEIVPSLTLHPLCGSPSLSVGTIAGGTSVNTVPAQCVIEIDRRILPGEDSQSVYLALQDYLRDRVANHARLEHSPPTMFGETLDFTHNRSLAERLQTIVTEELGSCRCHGVSFGTDASQFAKAGIPTVVFGPGSINQAHTEDEWIDLAQLHQAADLLVRFAQEA
ncbi:Acetylornithine deacetylase or succinyl-diaminopimelate desuccinylase [Planctomycetales bacterium 10988]|nr:Acetylornithine deacetylase or succinyl-diaminopimelate desuccinylase [Planctomycetales bacterium 10988]